MTAANDARDMTLALLATRTSATTICPSEVARALVAQAGPGTMAEWRDAMPAVHAAVDGLVAEGLVTLSWKAAALSARAGPYRVGRRAALNIPEAPEGCRKN